MATRMQQRRGTAAQWSNQNANPILNAGEIGWESDTNKFKIGNGVDQWNNLPYFVDSDSVNTSLGDYVEVSTLAQPDGVATLDSNGKLEAAQLPEIALVTVHAVANQAARLALSVQPGDIAIQTDNGQTYVLTATPASTNANWTAITVADPFPTHDTDDLAEGATNKYFSNTLARGAVSGGTGLDYNSSTGIFDIDSTVTTNSGSQTLTNKTISYADNTITIQVSNVSDLTATAAELNTLDGITASTAELNILDGATLTTAELNYVGGVTSSIQTQLDDKADLAGATFTGDVNLHANPTQALQAATKQYVDNAIEGLNWKSQVNLLANSDTNMTGSTGTLIIDSHDALVQADAGYRVLLTNQSIDSENGIYVYTDNGSTYTLVRADDANTFEELVSASVYVLEGTVYGGTAWIQANYSLASFSGQDWVQFSGAGTITAGTGILVDGLQISIDTATTVDTNTEQTLTNKTLTLPKLNEAVDLTATSTELNILDGATLSTAELNILDGVTASTAEINVLDGITASTEELNYVDGVTSSIQTQLDAKAVYPSQTGNNGKYLTTDGATTSWGTVQGYSAPTIGSTQIVSGATVSSISGLNTLGINTITGYQGSVGGFVALVSGSTTVAYSTDSVTWTATTMPSASSWSSVAYGNGKFFAVNSSSTGAISTDGITWTAQPINSVNASRIVYGGSSGLFIAHQPGGSTTGRYSTDGITWSSAFSNAFYYTIYSTNNIFISVLDGGSTHYTSADGISWSVNYSSGPYYIGTPRIAFGNSIGVALPGNSSSTAYTSSNGVSWSSSAFNNVGPFIDVTFGNGKFVGIATNSTKVIHSTDGQFWTQSTLPSAAAWTSVSAGNSRFTVVAGGPTTTAATSTDAVTWTVTTMPASAVWGDSAYGVAPIPSSLTVDSISAGSVTLTGNLTVNGTTTTINSTTLTVDDKNIELGSVATPTNTTADGGGITLKGATDKTFNWVNATGAWTSSEHINLASGKSYYVNGTLLKDVAETLTNKTIALGSNTISGTIAQFNTALTDADFATLAGTETLTSKTIGATTTATISANTATTVDTVAIANFTTMEYTLSIKQGTKTRSSKVMVQNNGTTVDFVEYGVMETGGAMSGITVAASASSTNSILQITITDAASTNATVKFSKVVM